nr:cupin domain-containing protein [Chloroflexaceae bacterium]
PTVLVTGAETGGAFSLVTLTLPPYHPGLPPHVHQRQAEGCYVLGGTLAFTHGDRTITLTHGASVLVPPGVPHTCWNPTAAPAAILLIYAPGCDEDEAQALASGVVGEDTS